MTTITFDTHEYIKVLKSAGITEQHAEAFARVQKDSLSEIMDNSLATKGDIHGIKERILLVEAEIKLLKWMCGTTLGVVVAILVRLFIK